MGAFENDAVTSTLVGKVAETTATMANNDTSVKIPKLSFFKISSP